jgi:hypothetical protein
MVINLKQLCQKMSSSEGNGQNIFNLFVFNNNAFQKKLMNIHVPAQDKQQKISARKKK